MKLTFADTDEDRNLFITIYMSWIRGGNLEGKDQLMLGNEITRKLNNIADIKGRDERSTVMLLEGGGEVEFTKREFKLLRAHCEQFPFPKLMGEQAAKMFELFENLSD